MLMRFLYFLTSKLVTLFIDGCNIFFEVERGGQQFSGGFKKIPGGGKMFTGGLPPPRSDTPRRSWGGGKGTLTSPFKQTREPRYGHKIVRAKESVQNYVMWSRVLKCSVKLYMIGSSSSWVVSIHAGPHT